VASLGALSAVAAIVIGGAALAGYSHAHDPVAWLGSTQAVAPLWFNFAGKLLPGLALAALALVFELSEGRARARRGLRIGTGLLMIAGFAYAAQGLFPIDPADLDGVASRRHAALHALAQLAWIAAAVVLCPATWNSPLWRAPMLVGVAFAGVLALDLALPFALWMPGLRGAPGAVERVLLGLWLLWPALLGWQGARAVTRAPG
jgi:hypothetical protein